MLLYLKIYISRLFEIKIYEIVNIKTQIHLRMIINLYIFIQIVYIYMDLTNAYKDSVPKYIFIQIK